MASPIEWLNAKAKLVSQFDRCLRRGTSPVRHEYLQQASNYEERIEILSDLLRCEVEHLGWTKEALSNGLGVLRDEKAGTAASLEFLRGTFCDRVDAGERPHLSDYAGLGYSPDQIRLRLADETLFLGLVIAGRWRLEQRLGSGMSGTVHRAIDLIDRVPVAIKEFRNAQVRRQQSRNTLVESELDALAGIRHPSICRLLKGIERPEGGVLAYVYEFPCERTLADEVAAGPLTLQRAIYIAARTADAIDFLHCKGFLHCDLKPSNILVDGDDVPHVADFGFAVSATEQFNLNQDVAGSRAYMAPETMAGQRHRIDGRSDIWSLGAILYETLTGRRFRDDLDKASGDENALLNQLREQVPDEIVKMLRKCVATHQDDRYDSACLLAEDLRRWLDAHKLDASPYRRISHLCLRAWRLGLCLGAARALGDGQATRAALVARLEHAVKLATSPKLPLPDENWLNSVIRMLTADSGDNETNDLDARVLQAQLHDAIEALKSSLLKCTDIASETFALALASLSAGPPRPLAEEITQLAESLDLEDECRPFVEALRNGSPTDQLQVERGRMHKKVELYYTSMISQETRAARQQANDAQ